MTQFRTFLNTDPPEIVRIWHSQPERSRFANTFSHDLFETMVLSKPYFEPEGLLVAEEDGRMQGFVHAGFAPTADWSDLELSDGVISLLLLDPQSDFEVGLRLLELAEAYLVSRGCRRVHVGSRFPEGPFYLGLFGGSQIPGVLPRQQVRLAELLNAAHYEAVEPIHVMQRSMQDFRTVIDRQQTQVRRKYQIEEVIDPKPFAWWETCTLGETDRTRYVLRKRMSDIQVGRVVFWDIHPLSRDWGLRTMGLYDLRIEASERQSGLGTFLVGESLKHMQSIGVQLVEAQVRDTNTAAKKLFDKFGFLDVCHGMLYVKQLGG